MNTHRTNYRRILGIDPCSRGFGFALLEAEEGLVKWGVAELYSGNAKEFLTRLDTFVALYKPYVLALESNEGTMRRDRAKTIIRMAAEYAESRGIAVSFVSRVQVRELLNLRGMATNHDVAAAVAAYLPDLEPQLPGKRRIWETERSVMKVFGAAALALVAMRSPARH